MKKTIIIALLLGTALFSGCDDKDAREYANKLIPVLDSYQEQISQKINAEKEFYQELADIYDDARKEEVITGLQNERRVRSSLQGRRMANGTGNVSLAEIIESMQDYAKKDFETTKELLQQDLDTRSQYLNNLESLEIELKKIKALKEALKELGKPKSDFKQFKQATEFILQTDAEINKLECKGFKTQLDDLKSKRSKATDPEEQKKLDQQIKALKERMLTNKCPE